MRTFQLFVALMSVSLVASRVSAQDMTKEKVRGVVLGTATEKEAKKLIKSLAESVIGSAHPTGTNPGLQGWSFQKASAKTLTLTLNLVYHGKFTQKPYRATATIFIDLTDPDEPEIDRIEFRDQENRIPANQKNLADLKSRLSKLLEK